MIHVRIAHCNRCDGRITWVTRAPDGQRLPLEPNAVSPASHESVDALVLVGNHAYRHEDLAEVLMVSRSIALDDARTAARDDFPWHRIHRCPYPQENPS